MSLGKGKAAIVPYGKGKATAVQLVTMTPGNGKTATALNVTATPSKGKPAAVGYAAAVPVTPSLQLVMLPTVSAPVPVPAPVLVSLQLVISPTVTAPVLVSRLADLAGAAQAAAIPCAAPSNFPRATHAGPGRPSRVRAGQSTTWAPNLPTDCSSMPAVPCRTRE
jgi:hypothetical protein